MKKKKNSNRNKKNNNVVKEMKPLETAEVSENEAAKIDEEIVAEATEEIFETADEQSVSDSESETIDIYDETLNYAEDISDEKVQFESIAPVEDEFVGEEYGLSKKKEKKKKGDKKNKQAKDTLSKQSESKESFGDFVKEFWTKLKGHIKNNNKIYSIAGACFVFVIVIVIVLTIIGNIKKENNNKVKELNSIGVSESQAVNISEEPLEENAHEDINQLFEKYFKYMQEVDIDSLSTIRDYIDNVEKARIEVKAKYIEEYSNINCYTKKGPMDDSYVCLVTYDVKMKDYDVKAPSLLAFLVCTGEDGNLYIYCSDFSQEMTDYTNAIAEQEDVHDLIARINTEYNDILAENPEYAEYMKALKQIIKNEVAELLAEQVSADATVSDNSVSDNSVSDNDADENKEVTKVTVLEVKAKTTVNVRKSDSELADRLGKVTEGTVLTCNKQLDNGWSQVIFDGEIGYIKTEFLEVVGETTQENMSVTTGTVSVKETVKIREKASTDSESLGVAYAGETFPLVEELGNGWTKILYDTKEAYIKTEFLSK